MSSLKDSCYHRLEKGWRVSSLLEKGRTPPLLSAQLWAKQDTEFVVSSVLSHEWLPKLPGDSCFFSENTALRCILVLRCQYIFKVRNTLYFFNVTSTVLLLWEKCLSPHVVFELLIILVMINIDQGSSFSNVGFVVSTPSPHHGLLLFLLMLRDARAHGWAVK